MTNNELLNLAKEVRKNAYAPSTNYLVGAALLASDGKVYKGANIEDVAIPALSVCAERVAISCAISDGAKKLLKIAVVGGVGKTVIDSTLTPCGVCLQYILDLCGNIDVVCYIDGKVCEKKVKDFFTNAYTLDIK